MISLLGLVLWLVWLISTCKEAERIYVSVWFCDILSLDSFRFHQRVATWGGFIFVLNLVGCHAAALVAMGRFSPKVYMSYTLFYAVGTTLAIQVPVVGWSPLKSLEQLGPCAVFLGYQLFRVCDMIKGKKQMSRMEFLKLRVQVFVACGVVVVLLAMAIAVSVGRIGWHSFETISRVFSIPQSFPAFFSFYSTAFWIFRPNLFARERTLCSAHQNWQPFGRFGG